MIDALEITNLLKLFVKSEKSFKSAISQSLIRNLEKLQVNDEVLDVFLGELSVDQNELRKGKLADLRRNERFLELSLAVLLKVKAGTLNDTEVVGNVEDLLRKKLYVECLLLCKFAQHFGYLNQRVFLQCVGLTLMNTGNIAKSVKYWQQYFSKNNDVAFTQYSKINLADKNNQKIFSKIEKDNYLKRFSEKTCIYTALFGDYDELPPILEGTTNIDYICFTDKPRNTPGWQYKVVELTEHNPILENRKYKVLPHKYLEEYDCSLYLDSNIFILADITKLLSTCVTYPFAGWVHPERSDVYDEIASIISSFRHEPTKMMEQFLYFKEKELHRNSGMIEACFLWRDHRDNAVSNLMEEWWDFIRLRGNRDQPGLTYLMAKNQVRPTVFREEFGNTRLNDFFVKLPHIGNPLTAQFNNENELVVKAKEKTKKVYFVFRENQKQVASTYMRGYQLSQMLNERIDSIDVAYVNEEHLSHIEDALVVITKGFLKKATEDEIALLKGNRNIIAFDFVDDPPRYHLVKICDVLIASSIQQLLFYKKEFPSKLAHMITHHTDPEIPKLPNKSDKSSIGYFGELVNAKWREEIPDKVDFVLTNTKTRTKEWIAELSRFNCHYAVRNRREIDGFKPFLKGFTAAHCNSAIIIPKFEGDARFYLTSDYPYLCKTDKLDDVLTTIDRFHTSFGKSEYRFAMDIMKSIRHRSTPEYISREFEKLLYTL